MTPNLLPEAYTNAHARRVGDASKQLNEQRDRWLNPVEWTDWVRTPEEELAGFPARPVAKTGHEIDLKKRTLTNLYNARPAWLDNAHKALDAAVAQAYGWADYSPEMPDEEILRRLLELNQKRASGEVAIRRVGRRR
jgi:ABC-type nitrate/sulfonate/bicarbonate transport system substrate-binding protein